MNLPEVSGNTIKINLAALGVIVPGIAIMTFVAGWFSSHMTFKSELVNLVQHDTDLRATLLEEQRRATTMHEAMVADRITTSNRLIAIEGDTKRIIQDIAEIKAFPRR